MLRLLFEKTGNGIYISHLDLMRLFQRAFQRAGLALTHSQGYNQRPSVSIALPLSLGTASHCEFLDFDLEGKSPPFEEIRDRLNRALVPGIRVREVYGAQRKPKELAFLLVKIAMEYDRELPETAEEKIAKMFLSDELCVEKQGKNGPVSQDILPLLRFVSVKREGAGHLVLKALLSAQNPTLNPAAIVTAVEQTLPELAPDFVQFTRLEAYDAEIKLFR